MIFIRPVQPDDLDELYGISLATGHEGGDASHLYRDGRLMGHIYAAPYALLAPELVLVVEDEHGIAGFALGAPDTDRWFQRLEGEWWPDLRAAYEDPGAVASPDWSPDQRRVFMIHHPAPTPGWIVDRYPAHMHLNLAPRIQGLGIGRRLFDAWLDHAAREKVASIHIGSNRANVRAIEFWRSQGFALLSSPSEGSDRTAWMGRA